MSSEIQYKNHFGTGYLDPKDMYSIKFENKSDKIFCEIRGDETAMKAFGKIPNDIVAYKYDKSEQKTMTVEGKKLWHIEITTPKKEKMLKLADNDQVLEIFNEYGINTLGKMKEWSRDSKGNIKAVRVQA